MGKEKSPPGSRAKKEAEVSLVRPSAAEYLTLVGAAGNSEASVEMCYEDENVWLAQKMMAALYDVPVPTINQHSATTIRVFEAQRRIWRAGRSDIVLTEASWLEFAGPR